MSMDVAMSPAPPPVQDEQDLEKEVDRIQRTAEKQLASVQGLNISLVKKIRKSEAQTAVLLAENKALEDKNADLVAHIHRTQDDMRTLLLKEARLTEAESKYAEASKAVIAAELAVKKGECHLDAVTTERDALESEVHTLRLRADDMEAQVKDALEKADKEKEEHRSNIEQRSLDFATIEKEKEDESQNRQIFETQVKEREEDIEQLNLQMTALKEEKEVALSEAEKEAKELEQRLEELREAGDKAAKDLEDTKADLTAAVSEKESLQKSVEQLTSEKGELEERVGSFEMELVSVKEDVALLSKEKEEAQALLDSKVAEAVILATQIDDLNKEREDLTSRRDELEANLDTTRSEADTTKGELESRNLAFNSVESERNLLVSEKVSLEKDYANVRDRSTVIEREKAALEKRVYKLEEAEKNYISMIAILEEEKKAMVIAHETDLEDKLAEQEAEFTAALRKDLDDVVERHASSRHERQDSVKRKSDASFSQTSSPLKDTPSPEKNEPAYTSEVTDPQSDAREIVMAPDVQMEVPEAPTPFTRAEIEATKAQEDGTLTMTREIVEDDFDESGPAEGATTEIVTEEVMEEVVVDAREADEDVVEIVDEEVAVPKSEADAAKRRQGGAKVTFDNEATHIGSVIVDNVDDTREVVVDGVTGGADLASEKVVDLRDMAQTAPQGMVDTAKSVGDMTKDSLDEGVTTARGVATGTAGRVKRASSSIWKKALCCVQPQNIHGEKGEPVE